MILNIVRNIQWLGHSGFQIFSDRGSLAIDPYKLKHFFPADIILITHPHFDHCSVDDIRRIQTPSSVIITEAESAEKLEGDVRIVRPGDRLKVRGFEIEAVPAYNTQKSFHLKRKNWLGFVIATGGTRIYHAGDTDLIPEMDDIKADIALLPVSGTYVMNVDAAVEAVRRLKCRIAIPMHYGAIIGAEKDADEFKRRLEGICDVVILQSE